MRTAAFVDAGYLYAAGSKLLSGTNLPRNPVQLDIDAVLAALREAVAAVSPSSSLLRVYWYDGVLRTGPTAEQEKLADSDGVKLRLGMIAFTGRQKGVDSLIVTDLIELARNHRSRTRFYCRATKTCASACRSRRALVCVSTSWGSVPTTNHASSAKSRTRQLNGSNPKSSYSSQSKVTTRPTNLEAIERRTNRQPTSKNLTPPLVDLSGHARPTTDSCSLD